MQKRRLQSVILSILLVPAACSDSALLGPERFTPRAAVDEDVTPPSIVSAVVSPTVIDASSGPVPVTYTVNATDDLSGMNYCVMALTSPSGQTASAFLTPGGGAMLGTATVPQWAEQGVWNWQYVECHDNAGNTRQYNLYNAPPGWVAPSFEVTSPGDLSGPTIAAVYVAPAVVDVTAGAATVTVTADVTDDLAGVSYCVTAFTSASGQYASSVLTVSGEGVTGSATIPRYAESGTWSWLFIECTDRAGNQRQYSRDGTPLPATPPHFEVISIQDVSGPVVSAISVTPLAVDASDGPVTLTVNAAVVDDVSGVNYCVTGFFSPSGGQYASTFMTVSGSTVSGQFTLPQYAEIGRWSWQFTECHDLAGNARQYNRDTPPPFDAPFFDVLRGLTAPEALQALIDRTRVLHAEGAISANLTALLKKLENARASLERGNDGAALNQLHAFTNELAALLAAGRITAAAAAELNELAAEAAALINEGS